MTRPNALLAGALAGLLLCAPAAWGAGEREAPPAPETPAAAYAPDRVIVQWAPGADRGDRVAARSDADVAFARTLGDADFQLVTVEPGQTVAEAIDALEDDPAVAVAERDALHAPQGIPNDPLFGQLWGLRNLGGAIGVGGFSGPLADADVFALGGWVRTVGTPSTTVAVIDSGYRFEHPDLAAVVWTNPGEVAANSLDDDSNGIVDDVRGADFVGPDADVAPTTDNDPTDDNLLSGGHGVHTAGTVGAAGDDGVGITGVAQDVRIMPLRVCSHSAIANDARCPTASMVAAVNYAGAKGARVANMSLGGTTFQQTLVNAIAQNPQTLYVISAGNDAQDNEVNHHYPCDYRPDLQASPLPAGAIDNVVCVAATNQADQLAGFSDYGATSVDLGAPGTEILSAYPYDTPFEDDFADTASFASRWPATGTGGGFESTGESPLTSSGMTDDVGPPAASTVRETTSPAFALPANSGGCKLYQTRRVVLSGGGQYRYSVLLNGVEQFFSTPAATSGAGLERRFVDLPAAFNAGGSVQIRFRFTTATSPNASSGVWLDDLSLVCAEPVGQSTSYSLLDGTSMAAPHVSGAAALLFSYEPAATVTEVRDALLESADPVAGLTGKTVTGGRLDVSAALDLYDETAPAAPTIAITPAGPANDNSPRVTGSAEELSLVEVYASGDCSGDSIALGTAATYASPGVAVSVADNSTTQFSVQATDTAGNGSGCSSAASYTESTPPPSLGGGGSVTPGPFVTPVTPCRVPALKGKTLAQAKKALAATRCVLGKVTKPKRSKGRKLIVKSTRPAAGTTHAAGKKVGLTLKVKKRTRRR